MFFLKKNLNVLTYSLLIFTTFSFSAHSERDPQQGSILILGMQAQDKYENNLKVTDLDILLKQYEDYESYRPDSFSDATRNPFGRKKFKVENFTKQFSKKLSP